MKTPTDDTSFILRLPFDPFALWAAEQRAGTDRGPRLDNAVDLAVWRELAPGFDGPNTQTKRAPDLLGRVLELVPPGASILDIGAGTGNYALPLAQQGCDVTALDHSPDMLAVLQRKLEREGVAGVTPQPGRWEDAQIARHDYVLAANCLYRTADLQHALERFSSLARKRVLIIFSIGTPYLLLNTLNQSLERGPFSIGARPDHVIWGLQALGVLPWVEPFNVQRKLQYADLAGAVQELGRTLGLSAAEKARAADILPSLLQPVANGWEYPYTLTIPLIHWDTADLHDHA
ncbi:MAG: methyltransferase domain-containing protein [Chloroflexota bacterium]|nr:methyltransferase domain-containing protein [Chloroflexota bacterium]MDE2839197.1 methyltransferase domain-containing protein [Chloroflexota bacterium]MDE2931767.1 methyltransferase domain-containing protein [Chloroflexota bacterium]